MSGPHELRANRSPLSVGLRRSCGRLKADAVTVRNVFSGWDEAVGPAIAAHARPVKLDGTVLRVEVDEIGLGHPAPVPARRGARALRSTRRHDDRTASRSWSPGRPPSGPPGERSAEPAAQSSTDRSSRHVEADPRHPRHAVVAPTRPDPRAGRRWRCWGPGSSTTGGIGVGERPVLAESCSRGATRSADRWTARRSDPAAPDLAVVTGEPMTLWPLPELGRVGSVRTLFRRRRRGVGWPAGGRGDHVPSTSTWGAFATTRRPVASRCGARTRACRSARERDRPRRAGHRVRGRRLPDRAGAGVRAARTGRIADLRHAAPGPLLAGGVPDGVPDAAAISGPACPSTRPPSIRSCRPRTASRSCSRRWCCGSAGVRRGSNWSA